MDSMYDLCTLQTVYDTTDNVSGEIFCIYVLLADMCPFRFKMIDDKMYSTTKKRLGMLGTNRVNCDPKDFKRILRVEKNQPLRVYPGWNGQVWV